jgi:MFS family permease
MAEGQGRQGGPWAVMKAVALTTVTVSPTFLIGALAVQIRDDVQLGPAGIGAAAAIMFGVGALVARPSGMVIQRAGPRRGMIAAAAVSAVALLGIATAPDFAWLAVWLAVAGIGNALGQPTTNLGISQAVAPGRLALAFGIKQASIPTATLLGGLAVPGVALLFGWRWAFAAAAVLACAVSLWAVLARSAIPSVPPNGERPRRDPGIPGSALVLLSAGGGVAAAAATTLGIFLVDSVVDSGIEPAAAGFLFSGAALLGLSSRVGLGALMDSRRHWSPYALICCLLVLGAAGFALLGLGRTWAIILGAALAYGAGWAWPGLLHYAVVRDRLNSAATATGSLQIGLSLGAAAGPLAFGILAQHTSYPVSWTAAAVGLAVAAMIIRAAHALVRRDRRRKEALVAAVD